MARKLSQNPMIDRQAVPTTLDDTNRIDIDTNSTLADNIIDAGLTGGLDVGALESFTSVSNCRDQMYQLVDTMCQDSSVSSIVRTYAEDVCELADNGHIVWCEATDPKISKYINYMLDVMNVDKHIYGWAYSLIKYGDIYLRLYRESDYEDALFHKDNIDTKASLHENVDPAETKKKMEESVNLNIHRANDPYSYYVELQPDPGAFFELTKFGKTFGYIEVPTQTLGLSYLDNFLVSNNSANQNYRMRSGDVNVYQADDFVHACLDDATERFPEKVDIFLNDNDYNAGVNASSYTVRRGTSLLFDSYKI